jgi:hypothetical protein
VFTYSTIDITVHVIPSSLVVLGTGVAYYIRSGHGGVLNTFSLYQNIVTFMNMVITSFTWLIIINIFLHREKMGLPYEQWCVALLVFAKALDVISFMYMLVYGFMVMRLDILLNLDVIHQHGNLCGKACMMTIMSSALFDPTIFKMLPWKRTKHTFMYEGFPCPLIIYGSLYLPVLGSFFQMLGSLLLLTSTHTQHDQYNRSLIFCLLSVVKIVYLSNTIRVIRRREANELIYPNHDDPVEIAGNAYDIQIEEFIGNNRFDLEGICDNYAPQESMALEEVDRNHAVLVHNHLPSPFILDVVIDSADAAI